MKVRKEFRLYRDGLFVDRQLGRITVIQLRSGNTLQASGKCVPDLCLFEN